MKSLNLSIFIMYSCMVSIGDTCSRALLWQSEISRNAVILVSSPKTIYPLYATTEPVDGESMSLSHKRLEYISNQPDQAIK